MAFGAPGLMRAVAVMEIVKRNSLRDWLVYSGGRDIDENTKIRVDIMCARYEHADDRRFAEVVDVGGES